MEGEDTSSKNPEQFTRLASGSTRAALANQYARAGLPKLSFKQGIDLLGKIGRAHV